MTNENEVVDYFFDEEDANDTNVAEPDDEEIEVVVDPDNDADLEDEEVDDDDDIANAPTPKTFKVMINHEERELSEEDPDFINYLQKGMDYDRVKDQVQTYKNDPRLSFVENLAKKHNMTTDEYINAVYESQYQAEINELIDSGVDEDAAKEVVDTRRQKLQNSQVQSQSQSQKQEEKELVDFVDYFKKINGKQFDPDTDTLPDEVWKANADGTPLKVAYMEHLLQEKESQSQKHKQQEEARKKAPVKGIKNQQANIKGAKPFGWFD